MDDEQGRTVGGRGHAQRAAVKDKLARLQEAGVGMLFIPTMFLPADRRPTLDRFITEVAPAFR